MFQKLEADMIGMGPYLMSEGGDLKSLGQTENKQLFQLSLNMIAVTRLVMGNINIAAATAMQVLGSSGQRNRDFLRRQCRDAESYSAAVSRGISAV